MGYRERGFGKKPSGLVCGMLYDISKQHVDVHHIKPKCEGGSDSKHNLIALDKFEHQRIHDIYRAASNKRKEEIRKILRETK